MRARTGARGSPLRGPGAKHAPTGAAPSRPPSCKRGLLSVFAVCGWCSVVDADGANPILRFASVRRAVPAKRPKGRLVTRMALAIRTPLPLQSVPPSVPAAVAGGTVDRAPRCGRTNCFQHAPACRSPCPMETWHDFHHSALRLQNQSRLAYRRCPL